MGFSYKDAGVDIEAGNRAVELYKEKIAKTMRPEVLGGIGGFAGLFRLGAYQDPVLVSGTDGVGTKLKIAFAVGKHDTIGQDLVAMCVNDIITCGAEPLFFLDYFATGSLEPQQAAEVVSGIADACYASGCTLLGGETAELPGFYQKGEYDLAGFAVGVVEKDAILDGKDIQEGDIVLGLASSGLHSNGYSLARKVLLEQKAFPLDGKMDILGRSLGEELLQPTSLYVMEVKEAALGRLVKGFAHITGGGFPENIPRIIPPGLGIVVEKGSWIIPPIFQLIAESADISEEEMFRTFNMGIGMVAIVAPEKAHAAEEILAAQGKKVSRIGKIVSGGGVLIV